MAGKQMWAFHIWKAAKYVQHSWCGRDISRWRTM